MAFISLDCEIQFDIQNHKKIDSKWKSCTGAVSGVIYWISIIVIFNNWIVERHSANISIYLAVYLSICVVSIYLSIYLISYFMLKQLLPTL